MAIELDRKIVKQPQWAGTELHAGARTGNCAVRRRRITRRSAAAPRDHGDLREAAHGRGFVVVDVEYRVELGDLQQVLHALVRFSSLSCPPWLVTVVNPDTSSPIPELSM